MGLHFDGFMALLPFLVVSVLFLSDFSSDGRSLNPLYNFPHRQGDS